MGLNPSFGLLACAAVLVACCARKDERTPAMVSGLAILITWGLYVSAWSDVSPAGVLMLTGIEVEHVDAWALTDLVLSVVIIATAFDREWGWMLWSLIIAQIAMHVQYQRGAWDWAAYEIGLDATFLAQLAVLFWLGGRGVGDLLSNPGGHVRNVFRAARSAQAQE